jgi:DNA-binding response OmpR family regulator
MFTHSGSKRKVLIVERHAGLADMIAEWLSRSGHATLLVDDFGAMVSSALEFRPDATIVAVGSSRSEGYRIARLLRGREELSGCRLIGLVSGACDAIVQGAEPFDLVWCQNSTAQNHAAWRW